MMVNLVFKLCVY